jgi:hypothetical protein
MNSPRQAFEPKTLIQAIFAGGAVLTCGILFLLSRPGEAPTTPNRVVFQSADGCFYIQKAQPPFFQQSNRTCASTQELSAFKSGQPSAQLAAQLRQDEANFAQEQRAFQNELARFEERKNSPLAALSQRLKPAFEALDKLDPCRLFQRLG